MRSLDGKDIPNSLKDNTSFTFLVAKGYAQNMINFNQFKQDVELHGIIKQVEAISNISIDFHEETKGRLLNLMRQLEKYVD